MMTLKEAFILVVQDSMTGGTEKFFDDLYLFVRQAPAEQLAILNGKLQDRVDTLTAQRDAILPAANAQVATLQVEIDEIQAYLDA